MSWQPISTAPLDETVVLLYHRTHGAIQGYFLPMQKFMTADGPEFDGDCWVLGESLVEEPVERYPHPEKEDGSYLIQHNLVTHWQPLMEPPHDP